MRRSGLPVFVWSAGGRAFLLAPDGREAAVVHIAGGMRATDEEWALLRGRPTATREGNGYRVGPFLITVRHSFGVVGGQAYGGGEDWRAARSRRAA